MKRVFLASPYRGDTKRNVAYARACAYDCVQRGESPLVPHLSFTQFLDDGIEADRNAGMEAGIAWLNVCETLAVYVDLGISSGMHAETMQAKLLGIPVELRTLPACESCGGSGFLDIDECPDCYWSDARTIPVRGPSQWP